MKSFWNYFASKMVLLDILQNVTIYLFKYFVSHIMIILRNDTFLYSRINQISLCLHNFTKCFSGTRVNQIVNKCLNDQLPCLLN